jgi:hypothetical protein
MVTLFWICVMSVEDQAHHVSAVTTFPSVAKHLIHVESVTEMILAAMRAKIHVLIAPGDSWMLAAFVENAAAAWPDGTAIYVKRVKR